MRLQRDVDGRYSFPYTSNIMREIDNVSPEDVIEDAIKTDLDARF